MAGWDLGLSVQPPGKGLGLKVKDSRFRGWIQGVRFRFDAVLYLFKGLGFRVSS